MADVHAVEGAVGGEQDYPLDDDPEDDEEEDEEDKEEMEKLMEQQDPDFDKMINE